MGLTTVYSIDDLPDSGERKGWPWTEGSEPLGALRADGTAWPRITVVVPSFNQGAFIEETLRSVLLQQYPALELIVMDGGSSDETLEVLRRYDPWITYWESERDRGQTHAINKGLQRASGEVFTYLNSDDLLAPDALRHVGEAFAAGREVDVVYGACVYVDEGGRETHVQRGRVVDLPHYLCIWERFQSVEYLTQPEVFCRTACLVAVGGFREELHSVMDFEMWLRLLAAGYAFEAIEPELARFRTYVSQKSSVDPGLELCEVVEEYATRAAESHPGILREVRRELPRFRAHLLVRAGIAASMMNRYPLAVEYCARAAKAFPRIASTYAFWAVLASPIKRGVPTRLRAALRARVARSSEGA